ncbi:hypothetical protein Tco_0628446 [Tanacetum coccineum]|uniref:Uncharacterized protein n=1 Tax=Tanacetum coccineum TaxID=301880 RepID=A0ABQ4WQB6_9ASTR
MSGHHADRNLNILNAAMVVASSYGHRLRSLCPDEGDAPRFLQLYIHDTANEVSNRMAHFRGEHEGGLKMEIVKGLIDLLDNHNAFVQLFHTA